MDETSHVCGSRFALMEAAMPLSWGSMIYCSVSEGHVIFSEEDSPELRSPSRPE